MSKAFTIDRVIIIQSLEDFEMKTGSYIKEEFQYLVHEAGLKIETILINCDSVIKFKEIINELISVEGKILPWLHIECHGKEDFGLVFENGSEISWKELQKLLIPLNLKTGFNLPLSLSTCYGAEFLGQIGSDRMAPAPCRILVGPTSEVDPGELMRAFRGFYRNLFGNFDLKEAVDSFSERDKKYWLVEVAERWFISTMLDYLRTQCNETTLNKRAREIYRKLKTKGAAHKGIGAIKRSMKRDTMDNYIPLVFDKYFAVEYIPEASQKFSWVLEDIKKGAALLKSKGIIDFN